MMAITIAQPWAQLLVWGAKAYETRSWRTRHRGRLLIHAGKLFTQAQRELCLREPFRSLLKARGIARPEQLPLRAIVGSVKVIDCVDVDELSADLSERERALGDFGPGRWAWRLGNRRVFASPMGWRGHRGLFEVTMESHAAG